MMDIKVICRDCELVDSRDRMFKLPNGEYTHINWSYCDEIRDQRIAELQAQLAAQGWRPVTEPPTDEGEYWAWDEHDGVFVAHYDPERDYDDDWAWSDYSGEMIPVDKWTPLVAPPPPSGE